MQSKQMVRWDQVELGFESQSEWMCEDLQMK